MTTESSTLPANITVVDGTDPRDVLARAMATAAAAIGAVHPDQMELPTPCHDFDVQGLLAHLVAVLDRIVVIGNRGNVFEVPARSEILPDDRWPARWDATVHSALDAWADDDLLDAERQLPWTVLPGRDALAIYINELTVHTWDLAHATGQQPDWDDEVLTVSLQAIHGQLPDASRAAMWAEFASAAPEGVRFDAPFADAVEVDPDAPVIERLVAWNGRRP
jgi:uncharacterized protein (TIGR03086 family)